MPEVEMKADGGILYHANPIRMFRNLARHRQLIRQFSKRQIESRYKGSYLGTFWTFATPLFMLAIYTFVFSTILKARWGVDVSDKNQMGFALTLFAGLIAFNVFSECIIKAPSLIVDNAGYVKKVVFPLEILPVAVLNGTLLESLFSLIILCAANVIFHAPPSLALVFLPLSYISLIFRCLGLSWFLAALGVYMRDLAPIVRILIQVLMFATPIFYPITTVPEYIRPIFLINPLTTIVDDFRRAVLWNQLPEWDRIFVVMICCFLSMLLGYAFFKITQRSFADVL
jgi:lipopolysaccharide transport system permease protein